MLTLIRQVRTEKAVLGSLYLNGAFVCYTLENAAKVIPAGVYKVENSVSPKFKRELPLLYNDSVKASRGDKFILIKEKNYGGKRVSFFTLQ